MILSGFKFIQIKIVYVNINILHWYNYYNERILNSLYTWDITYVYNISD